MPLSGTNINLKKGHHIMANPITPATFRNASDLQTLFVTLEELAVAALEETDRARRSALIWSMQKLSETAAKDVEQMEAAGA